jgi:hypothetical protein
MSFLSKRFKPGDQVQEARSSRRKKHAEATLLETHTSFTAVYRELKAQADCVPTMAGERGKELDWLAALQSAGRQTQEQREEKKAEEKTETGEKFCRPEKIEEDFYEQRSFVRGDCKNQLNAAKRKLKLRLFT